MFHGGSFNGGFHNQMAGGFRNQMASGFHNQMAFDGFRHDFGRHDLDHRFDHRHFFHHHRFAFVGFGFAPAFGYDNYYAYDGCWRRVWGPYGWSWLNVCYDY
jgi:hypothetical protein